MNDVERFWSQTQAQFKAIVTRVEQFSSTTAGGWLFGVLTVAFIVLACYWWRRLPPPGTSIALLALLGVLTSLHSNARSPQKAVYFLLAGSLLWIEIRAIGKERADDNTRFTEIVNGLHKTLGENQVHFNATVSRFETISSTITGGNSFCYMELGQFGPGKVEDVVYFVNHGKYPLYDVTAMVMDLRFNENKGVHSGDDLKVILDVGNIPAGGLRRLPALPFDRDHTAFSISFVARNGAWLQQLRYRGTGAQRRHALKVTEFETDKVLYQSVDPGFPKDAVGKVNWFQY